MKPDMTYLKLSDCIRFDKKVHFYSNKNAHVSDDVTGRK